MEYKLQEPLYISSRLMAAVDVLSIDESKVGTLHVENLGHAWRYVVTDADGAELVDGADLRMLSDAEPAATLATLISFLTAAAESHDYEMRTGREGENASLFPPACVEWAYQNSDELIMLEIGLNDD